MISPSEPSHVPTLLHVRRPPGFAASLPDRDRVPTGSRLRANRPVGLGHDRVGAARQPPGPNGQAVAVFAVGAAHDTPLGRDDAWRFVVSEAAWLRGVSPDKPPLVTPPEPPVVDRGSAPGRLGLSGRRGCDAGRLRAVARPGPGSTSRWGANGPFGISRSWTLGCSAAVKACTPESSGSCTQVGTWNGRGSNWRPARPHYPTCPCATQTANVPRSPSRSAFLLDFEILSGVRKGQFPNRMAGSSGGAGRCTLHTLFVAVRRVPRLWPTLVTTLHPATR